jgi:hypothetical protein
MGREFRRINEDFEMENLLPDRFGDSHMALIDAARSADIARIKRDIAETCERHGIDLGITTAMREDGTVDVTADIGFITGPGFYIGRGI